MSSKKYIVIVTDVVNSRKIKDRNKFKQVLHKAILHLNKKYKASFTAPIKILKGIDELAMVIKHTDVIYSIIDELNSAIAPVNMRYAIVLGKIDTGIMQKDVSKMDGEAFHRATYHIKALKKNELLISSNVFDTYSSKSINLLQILKSKWTIKQRKIYNLYKRLNNQQEIAKKMNVTQQTISKTLNSINGQAISIIERGFERLFNIEKYI